MTPTTRPAYDAKLDAIERIIRQVRRYDGAQAADLIVYGGVSLKELAWTELEPEEIASAAMGGVTEEFRVVPLEWLRYCEQWQEETGDIMEIGSPKASRFCWLRLDGYWLSARYWRRLVWFNQLRPLGRTWSQIESIAGGEGRR